MWNISSTYSYTPQHGQFRQCCPIRKWQKVYRNCTREWLELESGFEIGTGNFGNSDQNRYVISHGRPKMSPLVNDVVMSQFAGQNSLKEKFR